MKTIKLLLGIAALLTLSVIVSAKEVDFFGYNVDLDNPDIATLKSDSQDGNKVAQYVFGSCLLAGRNTPQDKPEGVSWIRKSAEQDFALAQALLGCCYCEGVGVTPDKEEGLKWLRKAVQNGLPEAQKEIDAHEKN